MFRVVGRGLCFLSERGKKDIGSLIDWKIGRMACSCPLENFGSFYRCRPGLGKNEKE
jgi:hypothetical protein